MMVGSREIPQAHGTKSGERRALNRGCPCATWWWKTTPACRLSSISPWTCAPARSSALPAYRATASANWSRRSSASACAVAGAIRVGGKPYHASRGEIRHYRAFSLPEEPLRNACVPGMSVAENMALRNFDQAPLASGIWLRGGAMREQAERWIDAFKVKTQGADAPIGTLSGGNVQRAVLASELSETVSVLIVANPVFGLDFAAVAEIHDRILAARNAGAAVLLVSEDLDELLELSDRMLVMFDGRIVHETPTAKADIAIIGPCMAGHAGAEAAAGATAIKEAH